MSTVLHIDCSARTANSVSRRLSQTVVDYLLRVEPGLQLVRRNLGIEAPPPVNNTEAEAFFTPPPDRTAGQVTALADSDSLTEELLAADILVLGTPMYNFNVPASLKAWIDYVVRPGKTFRRVANGNLEGLCAGRKVYVCTASSGKSIGTEMDHLRPYLDVIFGFIGITDVIYFDAEGLAWGEQERERSINAAIESIQQHFALSRHSGQGRNPVE
ncbi:MAG: NAD(P)H-dependent oxidoreductase [Gammaproteobacteria bacterium]|nr:NAD(P)H-dependent oxidoreductase [Gammaproteobacteria bacterium]